MVSIRLVSEAYSALNFCKTTISVQVNFHITKTWFRIEGQNTILLSVFETCRSKNGSQGVLESQNLHFETLSAIGADVKMLILETRTWKCWISYSASPSGTKNTDLPEIITLCIYL